MELSLDSILRDLPLTLRKTTTDQYDVYKIHANLTYKIVAAMIKLGEQISRDRLYHQMYDHDRDHFEGYSDIEEDFQ